MEVPPLFGLAVYTNESCDRKATSGLSAAGWRVCCSLGFDCLTLCALNYIGDT